MAHPVPASGPKIAWQKNVGTGVSSFVVVGHRVLTMGSDKDQDQDIVWCLDAASGQAIWQFKYPCKFDDRNFEGGTASTATGCLNRVFVGRMFNEMRLASGYRETLRRHF